MSLTDRLIAELQWRNKLAAVDHLRTGCGFLAEWEGGVPIVRILPGWRDPWWRGWQLNVVELGHRAAFWTEKEAS